MLSYRHAFHAGNHADVLKHYVLTLVLDYMNQKDKPYWYLDTHAGAGCYELDRGYAAKNAEFASGIGRLWQRQDLPPSVAEYMSIVESLNPDGTLTLYPGSPMVASRLLRAEDRLRLFELHPTDFPILEDNMAELGRQALTQKGDGFAGLKALLPPPTRRALTLIDPPYEDKKDYDRVVTSMTDALKRFATGVYAIWYPMLQRTESMQLVDKLKQLPCESWVHVALTVHRPRDDGFGMHGSGMFVVNPPWRLRETLAETLPYIKVHLAQDSGASFTLEQLAK